jgi:hypothetical protein
MKGDQLHNQGLPNDLPPVFRQYDDIFTIDGIQINLWFDGVFGVAIVFVQPCHIDIDIEVTDITNYRFIFH